MAINLSFDNWITILGYLKNGINHFDRKVNKTNMRLEDLKNLVFRENSYIDRAQVTCETLALKYYRFYFIILVMFTAFRNKIYEMFDYFSFINLILLGIITVSFFVKVFYVNYLFSNGFTLNRVKNVYNIPSYFKFINKYNGFTNFILFLSAIINLCYILALWVLDGFIREAQEEIQKYVSAAIYDNTEEVASFMLDSFNIMGGFLVIGYLLLSGIVYGLLFTIFIFKDRAKREIFNIDLNDTQEECKGTVKSDGIAILKSDGSSRILDLMEDDLTFFFNAIIILDKDRKPSTVYSHNEVKKSLYKEMVSIKRLCIIR